MRIVVTGANGFIGRRLICDLEGQGSIIAVDRSCAGLDAPHVETVEGDFNDPDVLARAFARRCDAVVHLATVPGGDAERDPGGAWRANVDGSAALIDAAASAGDRPAVVFASSIAVFGDPLPLQIDDATGLRPRMVYGAHKAMIEQWVATCTRRGAIRGLSLRLPGIVARPRGAAGLKSAFMSDVFHAALARDRFVSPVSAAASMWLMSVERVSLNLRHALGAVSRVGEPYAVTLPAVRTTMAELTATIARQTGADPDFVRHDVDDALERAFGRQPPLRTPAADAAGFGHDGSVDDLVATTLVAIGAPAV